MEGFLGGGVGEWMILELAPLRNVWNWAHPRPHVVHIGFKDVLVRAELEALLGPWEPLIKVWIVYIQVVQISEHQNTVIVCEIEVVVGVFDIAGLFIIVPLLVGITLHVLLKVAMDAWVVWEMRILNPCFIFASQNEIL